MFFNRHLTFFWYFYKLLHFIPPRSDTRSIYKITCFQQSVSVIWASTRVPLARSKAVATTSPWPQNPICTNSSLDNRTSSSFLVSFNEPHFDTPLSVTNFCWKKKKKTLNNNGIRRFRKAHHIKKKKRKIYAHILTLADWLCTKYMLITMESWEEFEGVYFLMTVSLSLMKSFSSIR